MTQDEYLLARGWRLDGRGWTEPASPGSTPGVYVPYYDADDAERIQLDRDRDALQYVLARRAVAYIKPRPDLGPEYGERVIIGTVKP